MNLVGQNDIKLATTSGEYHKNIARKPKVNVHLMLQKSGQDKDNPIFELSDPGLWQIQPLVGQRL